MLTSKHPLHFSTYTYFVYKCCGALCAVFQIPAMFHSAEAAPTRMALMSLDLTSIDFTQIHEFYAQGSIATVLCTADSAFLVFNRTSLDIVNAFLALN